LAFLQRKYKSNACNTPAKNKQAIEMRDMVSFADNRNPKIRKKPGASVKFKSINLKQC
jgi:hypothetical protein